MNPYQTDPRQDEIDTQRRENTLINKADAIDAIEKEFGETIKQLDTRVIREDKIFGDLTEEQKTIIGHLLTRMEGDIIKKIKSLTEFNKQ